MANTDLYTQTEQGIAVMSHTDPRHRIGGYVCPSLLCPNQMTPLRDQTFGGFHTRQLLTYLCFLLGGGVWVPQSTYQ